MANQFPDIDVTIREQLEAFLAQVEQQERGRIQIIAFAGRSALRSVPSVSLFDPNLNPKFSIPFTLMVFRGVSIPWLATINVDRVRELGFAAGAASRANSRAFTAAGTTFRPEDGRNPLSAEWVNTASAASSAANTLFAKQREQIQDAVSAAYAASRATVVSDSASVAQSTINADIGLLGAGNNLSTYPLWPDGLPESVQQNWNLLKVRLKEAAENWEVWTDWYDARLRGGPTHPELSTAANERIEVARVLEIEEEDWEQGPAHVNAKIKAIIERETELDTVEREANAFGEVGKVDAEADRNDVPPNNPASVRATWDAGRQKAFLDTSAIDADMGTEAAVAELQVLREAIDQLCKRLTDMSKTNIDRDGAALLKATHDAIPNGIPTSIELSAIIIREIVHERYHSTVVEQWPETLRAEYEGVSISLTAALDLFPERRQRRRIDWSAKLEDLPAKHVKGALESANEVLKSDSGQMVVDTAITDVIDGQTAALPTEGNLDDPVDRATAMDGLESLHNTAKTLARNAPEKVEAQDVLDGLDTVIFQEANAFEEGARRGVRKALGKAGEVAGIARVSERTGKSVWDRLPGLDWLRNRRKRLDPRVNPEDDAQ